MSTTVYINGVEMVIEDDLMTYDQLCELTSNTTVNPSIVYKQGGIKNPEGIMSKGQTVHLTDGMKFSVYVTGNG